MSTDPEGTDRFAGLLGVVANALPDKKANERLIREPKSVLAEAGLSLPADVEVVVLQNTPDRLHIVLPAPDDQLDPDKTKGHHLINMWPI